MQASFIISHPLCAVTCLILQFDKAQQGMNWCHLKRTKDNMLLRWQVAVQSFLNCNMRLKEKGRFLSYCLQITKLEGDIYGLDQQPSCSQSAIYMDVVLIYLWYMTCMCPSVLLYRDRHLSQDFQAVAVFTLSEVQRCRYLANLIFSTYGTFPFLSNSIYPPLLDLYAIGESCLASPSP